MKGRISEDLARERWLKTLAEIRVMCVETLTKAPIGSQPYKDADKFLSLTTSSAELNTGDPDYFRDPLHSAGE